MEENDICSAVREMEQLYVYGAPVPLGKYVEFDMYNIIETIQAYINSRHISGLTDSLGREKPFFNIVTAAVNVWYRATDLDRKNITIKPTRLSNTVVAFLANIVLQEWMRKNNFGVFLNNWGRTLSQYGSAVSKFVEKDGELYAEVIPWSRLICDQVDFENNLKIEKLFYTPSQLRKKEGYDKEIVDNLIEKSLSIRKTLNNDNVDSKAGYIEVYEVHGEMPLSWLTNKDEDDDTYVQQMQVISFLGDTKGGFEDYVLAKGKEAKDPYIISHLIKEEGRTLSIGAVEYLFDAQWMVNHSAKLIKDQLDLASKLIFQTADPAFVGYNSFNDIETGDIFVHNGNPLTQLQNNSHDISAIQNYSAQWYNLSKEITSSTDAARGNTQPSGTAYRLQALVTEQSLSLFELMTENKGHSIEEMMTKYIIPFIKKKLNTSDEIAARLDDYNVKKLDKLYLSAEVNKRVNKKLFKKVIDEGQKVSPYQRDEMVAEETNDIQAGLKQLESQRFIKPSDIPTETWKDIFKDLEWEVEVEVTGEQHDKAVALETLNTMLQTIASNPAVMQDPRAKLLFNKIMAETGIVSPLELDVEETSQPMSQMPPQQPQAMPTGGV